MHAFSMEDRVVRMLYGLLCDGKLVALCDIANRNGAILRENLRLLPKQWRTSLSEAEFLVACGRRRVFRLRKTRDGPLFVVNVRIITSELDELLSSIIQLSEQSAGVNDTGIARKGLRRTGLPGRPSSWDLIEVECRRRYDAGERYQTRAEWARVLIAWLKAEHKDAAVPEQKTVTNRLAGLMRELGASARLKP
jgi:hypothetical protein